jgi:hypothetical protein
MPKQIWKLEAFDGGINNVDDPRDIQDNQLAELQDAIISRGKIVMGSKITALGANGTFPLQAGTISRGYYLFGFSSDFSIDGNNEESHYLVLWDDPDKKLYYRADTGSVGWTEIDVSKVWKIPASKPCFYFIDGALRISDGGMKIYYGEHDAADHATIMTDSGAGFLEDYLIGGTIHN